MTRTSQWPLPGGSIRYVIPSRMIDALGAHPLTRDLYPLAFGHYRQARNHHMHRQRHTDELLIYCTEGKAYLNIEDEPFTIGAGDLLLLPKGASHRYTADPDRPWTIHWVHFTGLLASEFRKQMGFAGEPIRHIGQQTRLLVDFNGLLSVQQTGFRMDGLIHAANRLRQLLAAVPLCVAGTDNRHNLELDVIHAYMREHLEERLSLDQLANLAGLSATHFATRYRSITGESPIQHFLNLKVERACLLLDTTDLSFLAISNQLGYEDNYYFSRLFKKIMGLSPRGYRHMHRH